MNKKGFLMVDALLSLFILVILSFLTISFYKMIDNYYDGYDKYNKRMNDYYDDIFSLNIIGDD